VPREPLLGFLQALRNTKHDLSNTFAVLLALSELSENNPDHYPRLAQLVRERCPKVVAEFQVLLESLSALLEEPKLVSPDPAPNASPAATPPPKGNPRKRELGME
jgi:hypothetical protein